MITITTILLLSILSSSCGKSTCTKLVLVSPSVESRTITAQRSVVDYGSNPRAINSFVSLVCVTDAPIDTPIRWEFGSTVYADKMGRVHVEIYPNNTDTITALFIQNLTFSDNGIYTCEVRDKADSWISDTVQLNLLSKSHY